MADPKDYELLLDILQNRTSVRRLRPDPVPDGYIEKIIEAGRWAMSGANSQPWEFIVVKDPATKQALEAAYKEINVEYIYWMEQQRGEVFRHPLYQLEGTPEEQLAKARERIHWGSAPALIVVLGDGRRQWGTVMGAHTLGRHQTHLTDALSNCCMLMQLATASLGLASQWMTIHIQEPYKKILGVPDLLELYNIIPVGYPDVEPKRGSRRPLSELVHHEKYEMDKYMTNEQILEYVAKLRGNTFDSYRNSYKE